MLDSDLGDGLANNIDENIVLAKKMMMMVRSILGIGGESTPSGSDRIGEEEEIERVIAGSCCY